MKSPWRVERDVALGGVDELDLVRLALGLEARLRLVAGDLLARPLAPLLQLARDLGLDLLEILLAQRLGEVEVVVEAVLDRRADRDLHARVEAAHRLGEQVRRRVAEHVERVGVARVARRQDLDRLAVLERQAQVLDVAVRADEHRLLGELRPDRARGVEPGRAVGKFELGLSGRTTFMSEQDMEHPREDDRNDEVDESPVPDPKTTDPDADDVPTAD